MATREAYNVFTDLPQGIQHFMLHDVEDFYDRLIPEFKLPEDQFFDGLDSPILDSVMGLISFEQAITKVEGFLLKMGLDQTKQEAVILRVMQMVYWPLREMFGKELTDFLNEHKIVTGSWSQRRILYKPISFNGAVSELVNRVGLHSAGQQARDVLRDLLISLVKGTRVAAQAKEILIQSSEIGGLGLDEKMAAQTLAVIEELKQSVPILDEQAYRDYLAAEIAKTLKITPGQSLNEPDDTQIGDIKAAMPPQAAKDSSELEKAVDATYEKIPDKPTDPYLQSRLRNVISSRLRDVRTSGELLGLLQRDSKVGGLGLEREPSELCAKAIEESYATFHAKIEDEEKKKLEVQLVDQKQKIEDRRHREAEEHAKWYEDKIKKRNSQDQERQQLAVALKQGLANQAAHPLDIKNQVKEKMRFGDLVPASTPAVPSTSSPVLSRLSGSESVAAAKTPTVKVSAVTAAMAREAKPANVDGVRPVHSSKLQGLAEELGNMNIASFRRLGKTPQEATGKIKQRLDTLGQEAFEQKVAGIRGLQSSPLMKSYLDLVTQSFRDGKPIADVADALRKAGKDSLTRDEVEAIINLNNGLHF
jgi:hypothetical protein